MTTPSKPSGSPIAWKVESTEDLPEVVVDLGKDLDLRELQQKYFEQARCEGREGDGRYN